LLIDRDWRLRQRFAMALNPKPASRYLAANAASLSRELLVVLRPERWWSVDHSRVKL
jgi:hypothetical protein